MMVARLIESAIMCWPIVFAVSRKRDMYEKPKTKMTEDMEPQHIVVK